MSIRRKNHETGEIEARFEGAVLCDREENYHDDSDFYAIVWNDEKGDLERVDYATTRFAGGSDCNVDATPETIRKAQAALYRWALPKVREALEADAREIQKGDTVVVARGRKVPIGTKGELFWMRPYRYGRKVVVKVGIRVAPGGRDDVVWTYLSNLEKADPELPTDSDVRRKTFRFVQAKRFEAPFVRRSNVWV